MGNLLLSDFPAADHVTEAVIGEIRVDRRCAVTDKDRKMVRITSGCGLDDDIGIAPEALLDQAMVYRPRGQ